MTRWPCHRCGLPAIKHIGVNGYCLTHVVELLRTFSPEAFSEVGLMLPSGPARPEWCAGMADCTCARCGAQHIATPLEACPWCCAAAERQVEHQRDLVLRRPDVERDDPSFEPIMLEWRHRLRRAVEAGVVTRAESDRAWKRMRREADDAAA